VDENDDGTFDDVTDTEYGSVQAAVNAAGATPTTICLIANDTENVTVPENRTITLDLNGYVLKGTGSGSVITNNGTLTIKDSRTTAEHFGAFDSLPAGGVITGGSTDYGGGVYNSGTFTMTGGSITGNTAKYGGGVFFNSGAITVGGTARIIGNLCAVNDTADNLYLPDGKTVTLGTGANAPQEGMSIGVTTKTPPTAGNSVAVTSNGSESHTEYFFPDNSDHEICFATNRLVLILIEYDLQRISSSTTATTVSLTNKTNTTADVLYVLAAYDANGRMAACNTAAVSLQSKESISLTVSYTKADAVTRVRAFVLQSGNSVPLRNIWSITVAG